MIFDKLFTRANDDFEEDEMYEDEFDESLDVDSVSQPQTRQRSNVVSLSAADKTSRVVLLSPHEFSEAAMIIENLESKRTTIVNLEQCDAATAQRLVDYTGGALKALHGNMYAVSKRVLIIAPSCVEVTDSRHAPQED